MPALHILGVDACLLQCQVICDVTVMHATCSEQLKKVPTTLLDGISLLNMYFLARPWGSVHNQQCTARAPCKESHWVSVWCQHCVWCVHVAHVCAVRLFDV
jgi:hypothetical protein